MVLVRQDSRLSRGESRLVRNKTWGGNLFLSGTGLFTGLNKSIRDRVPALCMNSKT